MSKKILIEEISRIHEMMGIKPNRIKNLLTEAVISPRLIEKNLYSDAFKQDLVDMAENTLKIAKRDGSSLTFDDLVKMGREIAGDAALSEAESILKILGRAGKTASEEISQRILAYGFGNSRFALNAMVTAEADAAKKAAIKSFVDEVENVTDEIANGTRTLTDAVDDINTLTALVDADTTLETTTKQAIKDELQEVLDDLNSTKALRDEASAFETANPRDLISGRQIGDDVDVTTTSPEIDFDSEIDRIMNEGSDSEVEQILTSGKQYIKAKVNELLSNKKIILPAGTTVDDFVDDLYTSFTRNLNPSNMDQGAIAIWDKMTLPQKIKKLQDWIKQYRDVMTDDPNVNKTNKNFWDNFSLWVRKRGEDGKDINFKGIFNWVKLYAITVGLIQGVGMLLDYSEYGDPFAKENIKDILYGPFTIFTDVQYPCNENGFKALAKDKGWKESDLTIDADNNIYTHTRIDPKTKNSVVDEYICDFDVLVKSPNKNVTPPPPNPPTGGKTLAEFQTYVNGKIAAHPGMTAENAREENGKYVVDLKMDGVPAGQVTKSKDGSDWN
jgi:hypothetical protein